MNHEVKTSVFFRTDGHEVGPRRTRLQLDGWAGEKCSGTGARPQPWHCLPWIEGSTYGMELVFPYEEWRISTVDGKFVAEGSDDPGLKGTRPFNQFAPGHYGYGSGLDILVPPEHILRLETHPRFFVDTTGTCPILVPGHLQTEWWTRTFFVVFKMPAEGQTHIFRRGEGYGQALILPHHVEYDIAPMSQDVIDKRVRAEKITYLYDKQIGKRAWQSESGGWFNDKYKVMSRAWRQGGDQGLERLFSLAAFKASLEGEQRPSPTGASKITPKLVKGKKEKK